MSGYVVVVVYFPYHACLLTRERFDLISLKRTYAQFLCFLLGRGGSDFGCFEGERGEIVCCRHIGGCKEVVVFNGSLPVVAGLMTFNIFSQPIVVASKL